MGATRSGREPRAHVRSGESHGENLTCSTVRVICATWRSPRGTDSSVCRGTDRGVTAFASTSGTSCASPGRKGVRSMSRSRTITEAPLEGQRRGRRLPSERPPTHPGEILLEEFLRPLGISQVAFARQLGVSFPRLNGVIRGRRGVTADTALRLEQVTGASAAFWLGLQQDWDLWHAERSDAARAISELTPLSIARDRGVRGDPNG